MTNSKEITKIGIYAVVLICLLGFAINVIAIPLILIFNPNDTASTLEHPVFLLLVEIIGFGVSLLVILKLSMNFQTTIDYRFTKRDCIGILLTVFLTCLIAYLCIDISSEFKINSTSYSMLDLLTPLILMLVVSVYEETAFRLIPLITGNKLFSYLISTCLFTVLHSLISISLTYLINVFLISLLISIITFLSRKILLGVTIHFTWNYVTGPLLGLPLSKIVFKGPFELTYIQTNSLLFDTNVGIESSKILTFFLLCTISIIGLLKRRTVIESLKEEKKLLFNGA